MARGLGSGIVVAQDTAGGASSIARRNIPLVAPLSVNGHRYIRLEIKSAIVSSLNELSHAYVYSRSSTRSCVCCSVRGLARTRAHYSAVWTSVSPASRLVRAVAACVHGHEDPGSRGAGVHRGPTRRPRHVFAHTRTPMLRGRVEMLRWGPRPIASSSSSPSSSSSSSWFLVPPRLRPLRFSPPLLLLVVRVPRTFLIPPHGILRTLLVPLPRPPRPLLLPRRGIYVHPRN